MFSDAEYPTLSGTATARDFVEFPSQFNEHWASYRRCLRTMRNTTRPVHRCPRNWRRRSESGDVQQGLRHDGTSGGGGTGHAVHFLPASAPLQNPDEFEKQALDKTHLNVSYVPPRYRSSYFSHIWDTGYSAGYYAYLWTQMLADDGYQWFEEHGELTRANGDRFRKMVLSRAYGGLWRRCMRTGRGASEYEGDAEHRGWRERGAVGRSESGVGRKREPRGTRGATGNGDNRSLPERKPAQKLGNAGVALT